jgi:hypothetical protein
VFKKRTGDTKGCGKLAVLINQARLLWLLWKWAARIKDQKRSVLHSPPPLTPSPT